VQHRPGEQGDIITGWLFRLLAFMAVLVVVGYEVISIGLNVVTLDDNAREVARAARDAYRVEGSLDDAEDAAQEVADLHGVEVVSLVEDGDDLIVSLEKQAPTLLVHRVGPLEDLATATTDSRIVVRP
jgi:hypothetical protein